jgi:hypothetical protein
VLDKLFSLGLEKGEGIFFFLFLALAATFFFYNRSIMKTNNLREERYINTIDKLAEIHDIKNDIQEIHKANVRQESMLGRVLDRLPK